jgi:hypothetical protein
MLNVDDGLHLSRRAKPRGARIETGSSRRHTGSTSKSRRAKTRRAD